MNALAGSETFAQELHHLQRLTSSGHNPVMREAIERVTKAFEKWMSKVQEDNSMLMKVSFFSVVVYLLLRFEEKILLHFNILE